jgi:alanine-glyoxylate transaminase/(R)-3-amino-2-methylpropionate-pyruvate transaminase
VNRAAIEQINRISHTTTIYLNPVIGEYAKALAARMPGNLKCCYFTNSGSEANELAMLMARLYTGNYDVVALRNAYHGGIVGTMGLTAHSTWKFNTPHSFGIHHALNADRYRGPYGYDDPDAGRKYAADVKHLIEHCTPGKVAGFWAESIQGVGGTIVFPDGYLKEIYKTIREAGGLCVADEVQAGFGRTGTHFWGFETQGVIPDIVTMAKGIGNGAPLAAVVTTPEIAQVMKQKIHFNTYGGNPVSCAIGHAVLEVIEKEKLQQNCLTLGGTFIQGLRDLQARHSIIGDVRGMGLMLGVELVKDRQTKVPAREECARVFERAKDLGLIIGKGGLYGNVLRIKPPMCWTAADVKFALEVLNIALGEV